MRLSVLLPLFLALNSGPCYAARHADAEEAAPVRYSWTLEDVKRIALEQNPDLKSARANFKAASNAVIAASSGELPKIDLTSNFQETTLPSPSAGSSANLGKGLPYGSIVAGVSQMVYDFGKTLNEIAASKALGNAAEQQAETVREVVALNAEKAFYAVSGAQELVLVAKQGVAQFEETRRRIDAMVRAKARPGFDLSQAKVELSKAKLALIKVSNDRDIAKIFLLNILGMPGQASFELRETAPSKMVDAEQLSIEKLTETALQKRPELKTREFVLEAARARIYREEGSYYPTVSVGGWYGQFYLNYPSPIDNAWGAGVALEWNIFEGYKTRGRVGELSARMDAETAELEKQKLSISAEVAKGVMDLRRQGSALLVARENLENAGENLRLAKLRYDANVATFLELITASTTLLDAQAQAIQARYKYEVAVATLATAVGGSIE